MIAEGAPAALGGLEEELKDRQSSLMSSGAASRHDATLMHSESLKKCKRWLGLWEQKDERWRESGSYGFIRGGGGGQGW